jgi:hypothetical protein
MYTYSSGCNDAAYLSDVTVADGDNVAPGEALTKTWKLLNTGSCSWSRSYSIVFVDGADMAATSATLDSAVGAGASADVSVELTAPEDDGTYTAYWRLADANGRPFGEQFYVQIVVGGDAATLTPTPITPTATPTSITPTATSSATATPTLPPQLATSTIGPTVTAEVTLSPTSEAPTASSAGTSHDQKIKT